MIRTAQVILYALLWTICALLAWVTLTPIAALIVGGSSQMLGVGGSVLAFVAALVWLRRRESELSRRRVRINGPEDDR